jgi:hypothetical protein
MRARFDDPAIPKEKSIALRIHRRGSSRRNMRSNCSISVCASPALTHCSAHCTISRVGKVVFLPCLKQARLYQQINLVYCHRLGPRRHIQDSSGQ